MRGAAAALIVLVSAAACTSGGTNASGGFACDDARFTADRQAMANGGATGDRLEEVCGTVMTVLRSRVTRSGRHGYFLLRLPSGERIEVISNLDAMDRAPSDRPPAWPWVAAGDYVYVEGRYFSDEPGRDGIDWTEDDVGRSWPHTGYVAVCRRALTACTKYW